MAVVNPDDSTLGAFLGFVACMTVAFTLDYLTRRIYRAFTRARQVIAETPVLYLADYQAPSNVIPIQRGEQL